MAATKISHGSDGVATNLDAVGLANLLKASFESVTMTTSQVMVTSSLVTSDDVATDPDAVFSPLVQLSNGIRTLLVELSTVTCLEVGLIWRIQGLDKAYWGFLGAQ
ncbi:hypothetical protein Tco_0879901, partial [Tanacetum coccineum]